MLTEQVCMIFLMMIATNLALLEQLKVVSDVSSSDWSADADIVR